MANQVYLTVYYNGNPLSHPITLANSDPASIIEEFEHQVLYLGQELFFDKAAIRVHKPLFFKMQIEKITPQLLHYITGGVLVEKVKITWFQFNERTKKEQEYFSHLFEDVKFEHVRLILPDVKAPELEKFNHQAEVSFRYRRVTWTYLDGNLIYSDEWKNAYEEKTAAQEEEAADEEETQEETVEKEAPVTEAAPADEKKVKLSDAKFLPEAGKTDFKSKCKVSVAVEYLKETNKKKVLFKLFSLYNSNTQDMQHEVEAFESNGKAEGSVTLFHNDEYYSDPNKSSSSTVEYYVKVSHTEADEIESEHLKLPLRQTIICNFVEIPDILFNHNSTVPHLGENEVLIDAIVTTYDFAKNNSGKALLVRGHTDTSGGDDYNMQLSELRAKVIKALLDKDRATFSDVASQKDKVEDIQEYLKIFATLMQWDCDPGSVDNNNGPKTQQALKNFQNEYNEAYGKSIAVDGKAGPQTWGAVFDVIWDHIQIKAKNYCVNGAPPKLTFKGNGIEGCGEKYPIEAKNKNGYKSKTNRRVELVFADPGVEIKPPPAQETEPPPPQPSTDDPQPTEIVLEPIPVKPPPTARIKNISYWCSHEDGKRIAKSGEDLEIVPDMVGDKIHFKSHCSGTDTSIKWNITGYKKTSMEGFETTASISGFKAEVQDLFARLLLGDLKNFISPKKVGIVACDDSGKKLWGSILVYPSNKHSYELDLSKITKTFKTLSEKLNKTFEWASIKIEVKALIGKISVSGNFSEDSGSRLAYFAFEVSGGFAPLIGIELSKEFPLDGVLGCIPKAIKKYIYDICAVLTLKGAVDLKASVSREAPKDYAGKIAVSGSIGVGVALKAEIGNGKILAVKAGISSSITATSSGFVKALDNFEKWQMGVQGIKLEWDGLKGELSWELFDGTFGSNEEISICKGGEIWKTEEQILFGDK